MPDIRHRIGIKAPLSEVYDALATREGLAEWWSRSVEGESRPGQNLTFRFGTPEPSAVMKVTATVSSELVRWTCVAGPDEWVDTTFTFELKRDGDETVLLFTNSGWREAPEFIHHCTTKWGYFLLGLKSGLEGAKATPWPDDMLISSWG